MQKRPNNDNKRAKTQQGLRLKVVVATVVMVLTLSSNRRVSRRYSHFRQQGPAELKSKSNHTGTTAAWNNVNESGASTSTGAVGLEVMSEIEMRNETETSSQELNVTIVMRFPRRDRLGSNVQRPVFLMAYALCHGFAFCIMKGREGVAAVFNFPTCESSQHFSYEYEGSLFQEPINQSGSYHYRSRRDDNALIRAIHDADLDPERVDCAISKDFQEKWMAMILAAPTNYEHLPEQDRLVAQENLFLQTTNANTLAASNSAAAVPIIAAIAPITIAVNIRRGDIQDARGWQFVVPDASFIDVIKKLRILFSTKLGRESEVHIFSEDYGPVNWTAYDVHDGLVDHFHLAPKLSNDDGGNTNAMDMGLNIRDWRHFVLADVLIVGGSFSRTASFARPTPDPLAGLPLTLHACHNAKGCDAQVPLAPTKFKWSKESEAVEFYDMPTALSF